MLTCFTRHQIACFQRDALHDGPCKWGRMIPGGQRTFCAAMHGIAFASAAAGITP